MSTFFVEKMLSVYTPEMALGSNRISDIAGWLCSLKICEQGMFQTSNGNFCYTLINVRYVKNISISIPVILLLVIFPIFLVSNGYELREFYWCFCPGYLLIIVCYAQIICPILQNIAQ